MIPEAESTYIVMVYIVMAYIIMANIVMAYIVMAYIVVAYIVKAESWRTSHSCGAFSVMRRVRSHRPTCHFGHDCGSVVARGACF